jgi:quaternary ammonium compound-resistance protein SugE
VATRNLSLGTAYAIWTGIGAFGTVAVGILFFGDPATFWRVIFLTTLIVSLIGLRVVS